MTNAKLCKRLIERGIIVNFGKGENAIGFHVPQGAKEQSNTNFVVKNMEQVKSIKLSEWITATAK